MAGRTPDELSREFGVSAQSVTAWIPRAAADAGKPARGKDVLSSVEREELARLRRRVRQLECWPNASAKWTPSRITPTACRACAPSCSTKALHVDAD